MKLLKKLYKISSPSGREKRMIRFITRWLEKRNIRYSVDHFGNIYAVKGESETYPCLAAHTDEVHGKRGDGYEVITFRGEIIFGYDNRTRKFTGIGADDKNGIWVCLQCLETFNTLKCVFFTGEETGCTGSGLADMSFFDDCRFVLQCDRKGGSDLIAEISGVTLYSEEFLKSVNPSAFGYNPAFGLPTDVFMLKERGLAVSCTNISCGYYNPHTDEEYTKIGELENCLRFVSHIIRNCTRVYPHRDTPPVYSYRSGYYTNRESQGSHNRTCSVIPDYYDTEDVI